MEKDNKFTYTYSACEAEEVRIIREKYMPKSNQKSTLEQIRELDRKTEKPGTILSLIIGIIGTLIFGTGMSCVMVWSEAYFVLGIVIGIIGMIVAGAAYPIFYFVTKRQRKKIAPVILKLTEDIANS